MKDNVSNELESGQAAQCQKQAVQQSVSGRSGYSKAEFPSVSPVETRPSPIFRWAGGKSQLLPTLLPLCPDKFSVYCEPFLGGASMLLALSPMKAYVNDINEEIINVYETVRTNVDEVISVLSGYKNNAEFFYDIRSWDRDKNTYMARTNVERAARTLFLNRTCFNGLYRVNRRNEFNVPFALGSNADVVNAAVLRNLSRYLNTSQTVFSHGDYANVLKDLPSDTFVYLDPPYDPVSKTSDFTRYSSIGFSRADQSQLKEYCDRLNDDGIKFMQSNASTEFIRELYKDYDITIVRARRCINSVASKRGAVDEVVIRNY